MDEIACGDVTALEPSCSFTAVAFSGGRRQGVRLVIGSNRAFGLSSSLDVLYARYRVADATLEAAEACVLAPSRTSGTH